MRFGVLGALEVRSTDGRVIPVGGQRARSLPALLPFDPEFTLGLEGLVAGRPVP